MPPKISTPLLSLLLFLLTASPLWATAFISETEAYDMAEEEAFFKKQNASSTLLSPDPCADIFLLAETISYNKTFGS